MLSKFLDVIAFIIVGALLLGAIVFIVYGSWLIIGAWDWSLVWQGLALLACLIAFIVGMEWAFYRVGNKL